LQVFGGLGIPVRVSELTGPSTNRGGLDTVNQSLSLVGAEDLSQNDGGLIPNNQSQSGENLQRNNKVESILQKRRLNNQVEYLVKWQGQSVDKATWEKYDSNCWDIQDQMKALEFEKEKAYGSSMEVSPQQFQLKVTSMASDTPMNSSLEITDDPKKDLDLIIQIEALDSQTLDRYLELPINHNLTRWIETHLSTNHSNWMDKLENLLFAKP
jgi:hypothetical protein